jgi:fatty acid desaturase
MSTISYNAKAQRRNEMRATLTTARAAIGAEQRQTVAELLAFGGFIFKGCGLIMLLTVAALVFTGAGA